VHKNFPYRELQRELTGQYSVKKHKIELRKVKPEMKSISWSLSFALVLCAAVGVVARPEFKRPRIVGIQRVEIHCTNVQACLKFYRGIWNSTNTSTCADITRSDFVLPSGQELTLSGIDRFDTSSIGAVLFLTNDLQGMASYLKANYPAVAENRNGNRLEALAMVDPEGNRIIFVSSSNANKKCAAEIPKRLIHAGFVVNDRQSMDRFYRDVLGFHVYWHGGMKDGETDWVDMQVPDGTDWIEYMLNVPANADKHTLGVMNHIALGVSDVRATAEQLKENGVKLTEEPKIGRDGKWQLNLYDPDQTRVELMEFTPAEKPCCAEYTGAHPKP
jgi:catechol 2,3-dioxygenase-like lactoylglutathione lyase family enzyme